MWGITLRTFSNILQKISQTSVETLESIPRAQVVRQRPSPELLPKISTQMRLTKRMSESGICSRRQAERMIAAGMIKVDGKLVSSNIPVTSSSIITIHKARDEDTKQVPIPEQAKIWLFHKPRGLITTHDDPQNRPTVFQYLKLNKFPVEHVISVGRLDLNSEGLLLLTNNGDLARALELPSTGLRREYKVRAYGKFDEEVLNEIRKGVTIGGKHYKPMEVRDI